MGKALIRISHWRVGSPKEGCLFFMSTIEGASDILLDQLHEFLGHPFHVVDDEADENGCHEASGM